MTKITIDRATVEQALEALETCDAAHISDGGRQWYDDKAVEEAITALRSALAQQAEPLINQCGETCERAKLCAVCASKLAEPVEPVAVSVDALAQHIRFVDGNNNLGAGILAEKIVEFLIKLGIGKEQAEPVQEPFGYLWPTGRHPEFRFTQQKRDGVDGMPIYDTPPQRKPLTEEVAALTAQRDALLEALRKIGRYTGEGPTYTTPWQEIVADLGQTARAAIKAVEGEKT